MKVLMVNNFHYPRGGGERVYLELSSLLQAHGHEIIPFSTQHRLNLPTKHADNFVSHTDFPSFLGKKTSLRTKMRVAERIIYSKESKRKIEVLITEMKPDIAHLHGIAHYISPSILPAIKKAGVPIVMTLHDYKLICPNSNFLSKGEVCERCKMRRYYNVILRQCKRDSFSASLLAGIELYVHKLLQIYERNVDVFIAPSKFLGDKIREYGIRNAIVHIPNFIDMKSSTPHFKEGKYAIYFGRLSPEKGVMTMLEALKILDSLPLHIAGTGPSEDAMRAFVSEHALSHVTFHGHLSQNELIPLIQGAAFTLLPSEWYENYPMTILESFARGIPVIASDIGALPGLIHDGSNGLLFPPGDALQLVEKMQFLLDNPTKALAMGRRGYEGIKENNSPDKHYLQIIELYRHLLNSKSDA